VTITKSECVIVASVLLDDGKPGANVCTALGFWHYWESPEAAKLAEGILLCHQMNWKITPYNMRIMVSKEYKKWIDHPVFRDGLPLSCAESVAADLLPVYRRRRIAAAIADAYQEVIEHPESTVKVAKGLMVKLGDLG